MTAALNATGNTLPRAVKAVVASQSAHAAMPMIASVKSAAGDRESPRAFAGASSPDPPPGAGRSAPRVGGGASSSESAAPPAPMFPIRENVMAMPIASASRTMVSGRVSSPQMP